MYADFAFRLTNHHVGTEAFELRVENLTAENIAQEVAYFSMNDESQSFERTYGWAWLLKLQEELRTWDHEKAVFPLLVHRFHFVTGAHDTVEASIMR